MASVLPESISNASKEAVQQILPNKSCNHYNREYAKFLQWQQSKNTDSFDEAVIFAYFYEAAKKLAPSTLWSIYSMLRSTINCNHNVNIANNSLLTAFLKKKKDGFVSKKSNVFTGEQVKSFLMEAPDGDYLEIKTVMLFGICGACRGDEITNVLMDDVKDYGTEIVVRIPDSKTKVAKVFPITGPFVDVVRKYVQLRPSGIR